MAIFSLLSNMHICTIAFRNDGQKMNSTGFSPVRLVDIGQPECPVAWLSSLL